MANRYTLAALAVLTLALLIIACGSSPTAPPPPPPTSTTFQGIVAASFGQTSLSGTVSVTVQAQVASAATPRFRLPWVATLYAQSTSVSATGKVHIAGDPLTGTTLSGTFDSSTKAINLSGGGFSFSGTLENGQMSGTFTGPNSVSGGFSALNSSTATVTTYCGTFNGTESGVWNFAVSSNGQVSGVAQERGKASLPLIGQVSGTTASFTVGTAGLVGTGTGTIQGGSANGTWSTGVGGGTFSGSTSACQ